MKWKPKVRKAPEIGDTRIKEGFLFLPKRINNEYRWLETATRIQQLLTVQQHGPDGFSYPSLVWCDKEWV